MAQTIKLRRSAVAGNVPTTSQLGLGELAINTADGKIYFEKNDGSATIQTIVTTNSQTTGSIEVTGNISGSATSTGSFGTMVVGKGQVRMVGANVAIGEDDTGIALTEATYGSVAIGSHALSAHNGSNEVIAIGHNAMKERTSGSDVVAIGVAAGGLASGDVGDKNVLIGGSAGYTLDGSGGAYNAGQNVYVGHYAGKVATSGLKNTAVGADAGRSLVAGSQNVFLGYYAGTGGNTENGTFLGQYATSTDGSTNEIVIGASAVGKGSHTVVLGDDNITDIYLSEDKGAVVYGGTFSGSAFIDDGTQLNVPDYVFEPEYDLKSLDYVETHISQSKHLPGIPSRDDKQGWVSYDMGGRDMLLLEKIEELTLYVIQLEKRIKELENN